MTDKNFQGYSFSGHSDDVVCFCKYGESDEVSCDGGVRFVIGRTQAEPEHFPEGVVVDLSYGDTGDDRAVWTTTVSPIDEECECPWDVQFEMKLSRPRDPRRGDLYSPTVKVHCPPGTPMAIFVRRGRGPWEPKE